MGNRITSSDELAKWVAKHYACKPQEQFLAVFLDARNALIGVQEVSIGGLTSAPVDSHVIFAGALAAGASAIILVHTHPSGNSEPSPEDARLTRVLGQGAKLLGLVVLDHLVVARGGAYTSMRDRGMPLSGRLGDLLLVPPARVKWH